MSTRVCKICNTAFNAGHIKSNNKQIRISSNRKFCLICVPFKTKNPNQYTGKTPPSRTCKKCKKCNKEFHVRIGNKYLDSRKKFCFECLPFAHNYMSMISDEGKKLKCGRCSKHYEYHRRGTHQSRKYCNACSKWRYERQVKQRAVEYKGGKCINCGFDKFVEGLTFHHVDPRTKKFGISKVTTSFSWSTIKIELDKCVLLCANCHAGVHAGHVQLRTLHG